jgi:ribosomal protein S18 acetylase RimI-like enzyme
MNVRSSTEAEIGHLAKIWYQGWHEAHALLLPEALIKLRTLESFAERLHAALPTLRVAGPLGEPVGFCIVKHDELYQLFVSVQARGSGVAAALLRDGEARLVSNGIDIAWLACAIGNERAARFYERCGWRRVGMMINEAATSRGPFPVEVWRYEKHLGASGRQSGDDAVA